MANVPVHFIGRDMLIANKRAVGRRNDHADIEALGEEWRVSADLAAAVERAPGTSLREHVGSVSCAMRLLSGSSKWSERC